jgi:hypothetical protein
MPIDPNAIRWDDTPAAPKLDPKQIKWDEPKKNTDYEEGRQKPGALQGLVSALNGPMMGFGDEVLGAAGGLYDTIAKGGKLTDNYRANRDTVRGMQDAQREQNPILTGATQMMTSAPMMLFNPAGAAGAAARTTGIVGNTVRAAATGAAYGAVGGAGNSTADTLGGVALDAGIGGVTGGVVGGVATPVIAGMGSAGQNVMSRLSAASASARADEKVAQALSRDARGNVFTSGQSNPLNQILARQNKLGPEATITDAAGKNTNQLLDTLATLPGRAKESVAQLQHQRTATVGDRLRTAADDALGTQGQRLAGTVENLVQQREAAAGPIYQRLGQINVTPTPQLSSIVQAADQLGAVKIARDIATAREMPFTIDNARATGSSLMNTQNPPQWNMSQLDLVKQGLDQLLQSPKAVGADGRFTPLGAALQRLNTSLKTELDQLTFDQRTGESLYYTARNAFAGPSAMIDAANKGRMSLSRDEAAITDMVRGLSQGEMESFRVGAFEALRAKLGTQGGQTSIINMWKEPATREKLQVIFGDERSFREFASAAAKEGTMKRIQSVGAGSQTAARAAGMGDLDAGALADVGSAVGNAKTGNLLGAIGSAKNAWTRVGTPEPVRNEMARILLSQGPEATQNLNRLQSILQQINEQNAARSNGVGLIGSQLGNRLAPF